jgi:anthranilate synthase component I
MSAAKASVASLPQQGAGTPIEPDFAVFARLYEEGVAQVAWTRLVADLETPVSAMLKLAHERPNSFLLESVEGGATRGRYSIIGCEPDVIWRANGNKAEVNRAPQSDPQGFAPVPLPALASLRALLAESAITLPHELPPMAAGIFGYMGYDTVRLIERLPSDKRDPLALPHSILVRPTLIVIFDAVKDEMTVVTPVRPAPGISAKAAYARAADRLNLAIERLEQPLPHASEGDMTAPHPEPKAATSPDAYMAKVVRAKDYIAAGDIFQVVLSQRSLLRSLPGTQARQSLALPLLPQFRRFRPGGLEPGDPGQGARWQGHHPPDRRNAAARRHAGAGQGTGERAASRREGAGRASDAARSRP